MQNDVVLSKPIFPSSYDASSVLDFLWACVHIPKIWQGRERKVPKNQDSEDVLGLGDRQLINMVEYIIEEATSQPLSGSGDSPSSNQISVSGDLPSASQISISGSGDSPSTNQISGSGDSPSANQISVSIGNRMDLLTACICDDDVKVKLIVDHVENALTRKRYGKLYRKVPQFLVSRKLCFSMALL